MTKRNERSDAAYETFPGLTREEAEDKGYVVVEWSLATNPPSPVYGRYIDTESGAALEVTVPVDNTTKVRPAGGDTVATAAAGDKGALVNPNDPVIHGQSEEGQHHDGADAFTKQESMDQLKDVLADGAFDGENVEKASKKSK